MPLTNFTGVILASTLVVAAANAATVTNVASVENTGQKIGFSEAYEKYNSAVETNNNADLLKYAQLALQLGETKFGKNSDNAANLKYNLALSYAANKQPKEAFKVFDQVAEDYERIYGEYSVELMQVLLEQISLNKLYKGYRNPLDFEDVDRDYAPIIRKARKIAEEIAESSPERAAGTYFNFAKVMNSSILNSRFFKYAYKANVEAEKYLLEKVGEVDARTIEVRFMLGKYLRAKGKTTSSIEYLEQVVSTINSELDTSHPFELSAHALLVELYEKKGESESATEHCIAIGRMKPWNDEIEPLPLYRQFPKYPVNEARKGREGAVVMSFNIDTYGFVKDIEVIDSSGKAFDRMAIEALQKWRYAPKVVNGQTIIAKGMKVQIDFRLKT